MRPTINFKPSKAPAGFGACPASVPANPISWGLCIHRSLDDPRQHLGFFDVSDIDTGSLVARGDYPGVEGAIAGLVAQAMRFRSYPGGLCAALKEGRSRFHRESKLRLTRFSDGASIIVDSLDIEALTRGLNAAQIHLATGAEIMVAEDADWIASSVMERVGHAVRVS